MVFKNTVWNIVEIFLFIKVFGWDWISILSKGSSEFVREVWFFNPIVYLGF